MENFVESLRIMATGMVGIYAVAILLVGLMKALTTLFPGKSGKDAGKS